MEKMEQTQGYSTRHPGPRANLLGRRSRLAYAPPRSQGQIPKRRPATGTETDSPAGRPYFPSNGRDGHLNFLGRTSWDRKDRLLVNRV